MGGAVTLEQMVEVANKPISPLPWVNWYLMDVLLTALSNDPTARPAAAKFRDQLANVPAPRASKRGLHVVVTEGRSSVAPAAPAPVPVDAPTSNIGSTAVAALTADSQQVPDQVASANAPRRRGKGRMLGVAAALVTVIASTTAWMINQPASSQVSPAIAQSATTGSVSQNPGPPSPASDPGQRAPMTTPGTDSGTGSAVGIQLKNSFDSAKPFQTVPIQGTYHGGADTMLQV